jgi:Bacterial Ig-like domain (group 3)/Beta-propeller repeat
MYFQSQKLSWLVRFTGVFGLLSTFTIQAAIQPQAVVAPQKPAALLLKLPLSFEENAGQTNGAAKFIARAPGFTLFATPGEMVTVMNPISPAKERAVVRTQLKGADRSAQLRGEGELPGKSNYLVGNDQDKWTHGAAHFARIRQSNAYPGVDLVYHGDNSSLEYDFVVAPHADPKQIRLSFSGMQKIVIDPNGDLRLCTGHGELTQRKPVVYQTVDGEKRFVPGEYVRIGESQVRFRIGAYDHNRELVIDPLVEYATFFGGSLPDRAHSIAIDNTGNAYIAGATMSADFPSTNAISVHGVNKQLAFVAKINTVTNTLVYSTYFGATVGSNIAHSIVVDSAGSAYVAGATFSNDFPIVNGVQTTNGGGEDAFVAKLNAAGNALEFSTYLGGSLNDAAYGIALNSQGKIYVAGRTQSTNFPFKFGLQSTLKGGDDFFITVLDATAKTLLNSTYLGGTGNDVAYGIKIDSTDSVFVVGQTSSSDFPTTPGALRLSPKDSTDGIVTHLTANISSLLYSTRVGADAQVTAAKAVTLDFQGNPVVIGSISPSCLLGAQEVGSGTFENGFIVNLDPSGSTFQRNLCIRNAPLDGIAVGLDGSLFVGGLASFNIPLNTTTSIPQNNRFLVKIPSDQKNIAFAHSFSSLLDHPILGGNGVAVDSAGHAYMTGTVWTGSDFTVTPSNLGASAKGWEEAFLLKVGSTIPTQISITGYQSNVPTGTPLLFTATVRGTTVGNVTFKDGTTVLGSVPVVGSIGQLNVSSLSEGSHTIVATYEGDSGHDISVSDPVIITITPAGPSGPPGGGGTGAKARPTAELNMSSTDPDPGDSITATVIVRGGNNPTGAVTFRVDGEVRATAFLASTSSTSGTASAPFTPSGNGIASGNFEATYEGDENNEAATTNSIRVTTNGGILGGLGGGGCTIGDGSRDATLPILLLLALWGLWRIRRRGI